MISLEKFLVYFYTFAIIGGLVTTSIIDNLDCYETSDEAMEIGHAYAVEKLEFCSITVDGDTEESYFSFPFLEDCEEIKSSCDHYDTCQWYVSYSARGEDGCWKPAPSGQCYCEILEEVEE